jgi:hypothetical protein
MGKENYFPVFIIEIGVSPDVLLEKSVVTPAKPWSKPPFSMLSYSRHIRRFTGL